MQRLIEALLKFRDARNWKRFHSGLALSHKLQIEAGEVAELFEWGKTPDKQRLKKELADVFIILTYLAEDNDINLVAAAHEKIEIDAVNYPVDADYTTKWRAQN